MVTLGRSSGQLPVFGPLIEDYECDDPSQIRARLGADSEEAYVGLRYDAWSRAPLPERGPVETGSVLGLNPVITEYDGDSWINHRLAGWAAGSRISRAVVDELASREWRLQCADPPRWMLRSYCERACPSANEREQRAIQQWLRRRLDTWCIVERKGRIVASVGGRARTECDLEFVWSSAGQLRTVIALLLCEEWLLRQLSRQQRIFVTSHCHRSLYLRAGYDHLFDYIILGPQKRRVDW